MSIRQSDVSALLNGLNKKPLDLMMSSALLMISIVMRPHLLPMVW